MLRDESCSKSRGDKADPEQARYVVVVTYSSVDEFLPDEHKKTIARENPDSS